MEHTVSVKKNVPVKYLKANMGVRYWEDATVDGKEEDDNNPSIPLRSGDGWEIIVDLGTGRIDGWPDGVTAKTHYKVCDAGIYSLLNAGGEEVVSRDGYVPSMLYPKADGYGDYVILNIDGSGRIENWEPELSYFEGEE